jgi:hypothetical protein
VISGLVRVTHAGAPVGPEDAFTYAAVQSVLGKIEHAIQPFLDRMRELGGYVVADIPLGFEEVNIQVGGLPPDLADEILARCRGQAGG